ncbi:glycosyltransferase family 2 protein [Tuanshanicoccus lijuaniae]|uniref:glycosyltransferase family 2 protein n=1 Tax=Aerococcaceae bacterium zg-1292 TaxID=2774330 RepID=UPI00193540F1|nr:glycosyltransferase family 2 protein [Aerococcaceae bacterium zg-1292]QQA36629.1 glycosyltransferase family 2 protein [Aerococcaceae bacterium zg-1292]
MIISIGIVALNEEKYLPRILKDILSQSYPKEKIEIVLVDSMSNDTTKEIMTNFKANNPKYFNIQILDNKKRKQASGWNIAIKNFKGDALTRIDAHASIPSDFIEKNVNNLLLGESISGGARPCITENPTAWNKLLLSAENSIFGSSFSKYRRTTERKYVNTMFHSTYLRKVFEEVGLFNEKLGRTEDNEFHYRVSQAGFNLLFDSSIISYQYVRNTLLKMVKQKFQNGYWIGLTSGICPKCLSLFHFVPLLFVLSIVFSLLLCTNGYIFMLISILTVYLLFVFTGTFLTMKNDSDNIYYLLLPIIFFLLHISYGIGTIIGLLYLPWWKNKYY